VELSTTVELDGQYRALREEAASVGRQRGALTVAGADAAAYLQGQLTNDVEALAPGEGCYAALLDRKGHIQCDMRVLNLERGGIWLDPEPAAADAALRHLRTYSIGREVENSEVTAEWDVTSVIGPRAAELSGFDRLDSENAQHLRDWDGIQALGVATYLGVDLITRSEDADGLRECLIAAGIPEVSEQAAEIVRVESGRPRFGFDFGPALMPAEAGIVERSVDFEKGCYIGQEPVARLHYRGKPNRRLVGLRLSRLAEHGAELRLGDRKVGSVGTACLSPACGPIALAVVRREADEGSELSVGDGKVTAEVVALPFGRFG
jgi:folate-binding protein YgfZ